MTLKDLWRELRTPVIVGGYRPIRRPTYPVDQRLVERQIEAAKRCPVNEIRAVVARSR
jgi:hypothetical protein